MIFMIQAAMFHGIVPCVAITLSDVQMASVGFIVEVVIDLAIFSTSSFIKNKLLKTIRN